MKIIAFRQRRNGDATVTLPITMYKPRVYYTINSRIGILPFAFTSVKAIFSMIGADRFLKFF